MAKLKDERIIKESNAIIAPLYSVIVILSVAIIIIKYLIFTPELIYYYLEVIAVCVSILYLIIRTLISRIPLKMQEIHVLKSCKINTARIVLIYVS